MTKPSPALVTQRAVERLPRLALLLFCAAYVLPGLFGRDPWKSADISAVGYMARLAAGTTAWLHPELADLPAPGGVLPYWLGAACIKWLAPWVTLPVAARLPFALLLASTLALTWYACFHLAKRDSAQPLAFAFGGEARPLDYARAIADGSVLALIAQLGLLQLGHETTPELVQLFASTLLLYGLAAEKKSTWKHGLALLTAPGLLAASGAPVTAVLLGLSSTAWILFLGRRPPQAHLSTTGMAADNATPAPGARAPLAWLCAGVALAVGIATGLQAWHWRLGSWENALGFAHLMAWFAWPVWPMVGWTLWRWRAHWTHPHIALPLTCALVCMGVSIGMGSNDRALMLALPGLAVLGSFALPTLRRSLSAAMDWFSVLFFSGWALTFWVVYVSMHTGAPRQPAANVARLVPGFQPTFSLVALLLAAIGTLAWLWLVSWRTGRHRHPLWKSLVLPAGGVALNWLLAMTLLLPPLDYARSYRIQMVDLARYLPSGSCVQADDLTRAEIAAIEVIGGWAVVPRHASARCDWMLQSRHIDEAISTPAGWHAVARARRPADRDATLVVLRRN